jgi:hypothetical protein
LATILPSSALTISDVMENPSANWENGNRDQQTSPHAGWVIDGFGPPSFGSGSKYPDFVAKYSDATSAGSTDIKIENCGARYWVVGSCFPLLVLCRMEI